MNEVLRITEPGERDIFLHVQDCHIDAMGISRSLAGRLNSAWFEVASVGQADGLTLSSIDHAEAMYMSLSLETDPVPFNQCLRWEMLICLLKQLVDVERHFANL